MVGTGAFGEFSLITWKHLDDLRGLDGRAVQYPRRVHPQPRHHPSEREAREQEVTQLLIVGVLAHFGSLQRVHDHARKYGSQKN